MDELFCGLSISCRGNLAEKMHAIFRCFEKSGDKRLDFEELMHFFMGIFTILMQGIVLPQGVTKEILSHTLIKEIFNKFDLDIDEEGVSYEQMMKWIAVVSN